MLNLKKALNLKFQIIIEIIYSLLPPLYNRYFMRWKTIPDNELKHLEASFDLSTIKKIVLIGGGAVPYTAIYLNKVINPNLSIIIEKDKLASLAALRLLKKLNFNNFKVLNIRGEDYSQYDNSLVIVTLNVTEKQRIVDKILNGYSNNILIIRQPSNKNKHVFESVSFNGFRYVAITQEPNFESLILMRKS